MHRHGRLRDPVFSLSFSVTAFFAAAAVACLVWWVGADPYAALAPRLPGMDGTPKKAPRAAEAVRIGESFTSFAELTAVVPGEWPRFRGKDFHNAADAVLSRSWEQGAPRLLWSVALGEGHAGPAVSGGRVYVLDYDEAAGADVLRCFSLSDGRELWRRGYSVTVKRNHGMSRSIPAVSDGRVVSLGPRGHVMCVTAEGGEFLWGIDLVAEYGTEIPPWYTAQCPLIDRGIAVIAPGGTAIMIGVRCDTGEVAWETPNTFGWGMSHSSIMPMKIAGRSMYVYCAHGGVIAVSAEEEDRGEVLWATDLWSPEVAAPSPVILDDGRIFLTAGYGAGSMLLQVSPEPGGFAVRSLGAWAPGEALSCEQQTPLYYRGLLYGVAPKDAGGLRGQFLCFDPERREILWSSGKTERFGLGPYLVSGGIFVILDDDGTLSLVDGESRSFRLFARAGVLDGRDAWAPMAMAAGRLLLRDSRRMVCLELR